MIWKRERKGNWGRQWWFSLCLFLVWKRICIHWQFLLILSVSPVWDWHHEGVDLTVWILNSSLGDLVWLNFRTRRFEKSRTRKKTFSPTTFLHQAPISCLRSLYLIWNDSIMNLKSSLRWRREGVLLDSLRSTFSAVITLFTFMFSAVSRRPRPPTLPFLLMFLVPFSFKVSSKQGSGHSAAQERERVSFEALCNLF